MKFTTQRKAFSMLTAIFVIVIMASVAALVVNLSGKMVKETTAQFQREQAMLLAKSYTEYAIMAVMANDRKATNKCLKTINGNNVMRVYASGGFQVRVRIAYIGNVAEVGMCGSSRLSSSVTTTKSPLNIIIDVYVKYQDFDAATTQWITYHKRTLQKI